MKKFTNNARNAITLKVHQIKNKFMDNTGEGYIDTAIKILLAVVLGALLLAGLYALFNDTLLFS